VAKLRHPIVSRALEDFQQGGLHEEVSSYVCGNCRPRVTCDDKDGKPECEGLALMATIENQVSDSGIQYMKERLKAWGEIVEEKESGKA